MKWVGVLPFVYAPYLKECRKTMHPDFVHNVLFIDNTVNNIGIMASHNRGVDFMKEREADWLIIISAAIRFGKPGGMDFIKQLESSDHHVLHGRGKPDELGRQVPYGWHLVAFRREVVENVGGWDENYTPYSLDDIDLSIRIQKFYGDKLKWGTVPCEVSDTISAHGINLAGVKGEYAPRNSYFKRKWGRDGGEWDKPAYDHPFNDKTKPLSWWPKFDHPLSIDSVEFKNGRDY